MKSGAQKACGLLGLAALLVLGCSGQEPAGPTSRVARLGFLVSPRDVESLAPMTPAVQVALLDTLSQIVPTASDTISVALRMNANGATLSGTTTVVASGGIATFTDLHVSHAAGGYVLVVTAPGVPPLISQPFEVIATAGIRR